MLLEPETNVTA